MVLPPTDFKSVASADSAIAPAMSTYSTLILRCLCFSGQAGGSDVLYSDIRRSNSMLSVSAKVILKRPDHFW